MAAAPEDMDLDEQDPSAEPPDVEETDDGGAIVKIAEAPAEDKPGDEEFYRNLAE